jgi:hypothetical protein
MASFPEALVAAASACGSMLAVAERLGVAPQTVYLWIAGLSLPDKEEQERLLALLEPFRPASRGP